MFLAPSVFKMLSFQTCFSESPERNCVPFSVLCVMLAGTFNHIDKCCLHLLELGTMAEGDALEFSRSAFPSKPFPFFEERWSSKMLDLDGVLRNAFYYSILFLLKTGSAM